MSQFTFSFNNLYLCNSLYFLRYFHWSDKFSFLHSQEDSEKNLLDERLWVLFWELIEQNNCQSKLILTHMCTYNLMKINRSKHTHIDAWTQTCIASIQLSIYRLDIIFCFVGTYFCCSNLVNQRVRTNAPSYELFIFKCAINCRIDFVRNPSIHQNYHKHLITFLFFGCHWRYVWNRRHPLASLPCTSLGERRFHAPVAQGSSHFHGNSDCSFFMIYFQNHKCFTKAEYHIFEIIWYGDQSDRPVAYRQLVPTIRKIIKLFCLFYCVVLKGVWHSVLVQVS